MLFLPLLTSLLARFLALLAALAHFLDGDPRGLGLFLPRSALGFLPGRPDLLLPCLADLLARLAHDLRRPLNLLALRLAGLNRLGSLLAYLLTFGLAVLGRLANLLLARLPRGLGGLGAL